MQFLAHYFIVPQAKYSILDVSTCILIQQHLQTSKNSTVEI